MSTNTSNKVIGYFDEWGYAYCLKHGSKNNESILNTPDVWERCEICDELIIGDFNVSERFESD